MVADACRFRDRQSVSGEPTDSGIVLASEEWTVCEFSAIDVLAKGFGCDDVDGAGIAVLCCVRMSHKFWSDAARGLAMKLRVFANGPVVTIKADASIDDAIALLEEHNVRHVPVVREGVPVGMVSAGDVLQSVGGLLSEQRVSTADASVPFAGPTSVDQIMSKDVVAFSPDDDAAQAVRAMLAEGIRAVVVVVEGRAAGIVTETDLLKAVVDEGSSVPQSCRDQTVAVHMAKDVVSADPDDNPFALIRKMEHRLHHLPVVEKGRLVGIISDHDVRRAIAMDRIEKITDRVEYVRLMENYEARRIMHDYVETIDPGATLAAAAARMIEDRIGSLPVVDGDELVGMITETDILKACVDTLDD